MIKIVKLLLFFCSVQIVWAESIDEPKPPVWTLSAKPRFCVVPYNKTMCQMTTDLFWSGSREANICLLSSQHNNVLQCWLSSLNGLSVQEVNSDKPITFWLTLKGDETVLVKTNIQIINIPQKRVRTRRRHILSLL